MIDPDAVRLTLRGMIAPCVLDGPMDRDEAKASRRRLRPHQTGIVREQGPVHRAEDARDAASSAAGRIPCARARCTVSCLLRAPSFAKMRLIR